MAMPKMPKFETEAEEAQWWFDHRDDLTDEFIRRAAEGTLGEGTMRRALKRQKAREKSGLAAALTGFHSE